MSKSGIPDTLPLVRSRFGVTYLVSLAITLLVLVGAITMLPIDV